MMKTHKSQVLSIAAMLLLCGLVWAFFINHDSALEKVGNHTVEIQGDGSPKKAVFTGEQDAPSDASNEASDDQNQSEESIFVDWQSKLSLPAQLEEIEPLSVDRSEPLIEKIDGLMAAAVAGDASAAWKVAASLGHCVGAPRSEEQLRNLINRTWQTRQVEGKTYPVDDPGPAIDNFKIRYQFCKGIEKDQALDHLIYMKLAAEHGNRQAQIDFDNSAPLFIEDTYESFARAWGGAEFLTNVEFMNKEHTQHLLEASKAGYLEAFEALGRHAESGYSGLSIVEAKAYQIAGYHLLGVAAGDRSAYEYSLNRIVNSVGPSEAEAAIRRANQIIQSESCCKYIGRRQLIGEKE